jgi:hypothetical protein
MPKPPEIATQPRLGQSWSSPDAAVTSRRPRPSWGIWLALAAVTALALALSGVVVAERQDLARDRAALTSLQADKAAAMSRAQGLQNQVSSLTSQVSACSAAASEYASLRRIAVRQNKWSNDAINAANLGYYALSHYYTAKANVLINHANGFVSQAAADLSAC